MATICLKWAASLQTICANYVSLSVTRNTASSLELKVSYSTSSLNSIIIFDFHSHRISIVMNRKERFLQDALHAFMLFAKQGTNYTFSCLKHNC